MKNKSSFFILSFIVLFFCNVAKPQLIPFTDKNKLKEKEDTLKVLAKDLITDSTTADRMRSDSLFIRTLVRTLHIRNSFYYPFDSVVGISKLYSPDSFFRIITWAIKYDEYYARQRGAIQLRTADGSLKLFPLRDCSEFTANPMDSVRTKDNWIGAVYYNMVKTEYKGKKYYTLFGYDYNSAMSSKKWIEVLSFNEKNEPVFGGPFFSFEKDKNKQPSQFRYSIEYKKEATAFMNFLDEDGMIMIDHLVSETDEPQNKWTYVPYGDYEGFKWQNGKWVHVEEIDASSLKGKAISQDQLLYDSNGNPIDEKPQKKKKDGGGDN